MIQVKTVRLHMIVPKRTKRLLEDLVKRTHATTLTEVVRNALSVYDLFLSQDEEGREIISRKKNAKPGEDERLILIANKG